MEAPIYFIAGPTATGKTQTAIALARELGGEIVSADSVQVYRYMDIGTAKPSPEEQQNAPHHLIGVVDPDELFSVARYQKMARDAIADIQRRGKTPIVAGGSGFYLNALLYETEFGGARAEDLRERLQALAREQGNSRLHDELCRADPDAAKAIHPNDVKRVIRALEYHALTGAKISEHNRLEKTRRPLPNARLIILTAQRGSLYARVNSRVENMFAQGLAEEVESLLARGYGENLPSMRSLGYKETVAYIRGRLPLAEAKEFIKQSTRRYAKRQITWLKHQCGGLWMDIDEWNIHDIIKNVILAQ
ncbi:MAG: tRNA (adenosine(37)-N6)-dimethylallyltransferase MiaA [Clostridiales bacterium]|jgi:tRNA dimethylallyltransferase|nr:tRNA (adenosine(37)-N6)-dimethylallyltransferase MiaA [Clostridiales bacterium]